VARIKTTPTITVIPEVVLNCIVCDSFRLIHRAEVEWRWWSIQRIH